MSKNWVLNLVLLACIGTSSSNMFADHLFKEVFDKAKSLNPHEKAIAAGIAIPAIFMAASIFSLLHNQPKVRFESKGKWKDLFNFKLLATSPREYWRNVYNVYWFLWVGQYYKDGHMECKPDGTLKQTHKKLPHGVLGHAHAKLFVLKKTCGVFGDLASLLATTASFLFVAEKLGFIKFPKTDQKSSDDVVLRIRTEGSSVRFVVENTAPPTYNEATSAPTTPTVTRNTSQ